MKLKLNSYRILNHIDGDIEKINFNPDAIRLEIKLVDDKRFNHIYVKDYLYNNYNKILLNIKYIKQFIVEGIYKDQKMYFDIYYKFDLQKIGEDYKNGVLDIPERKVLTSQLNYLIFKESQYITDESLLEPCNYIIQPRKGQLYSYQEQNVEWMLKIEKLKKVKLYQNNSLKIYDNVFYNEKNCFNTEIEIIEPKIYGGALLDEMGCGKTACAITLATTNLPSYLDIENRMLKEGRIYSRATLVIVPNHIVEQWKKEIYKFNISKKNLHITTITNIIDYNKNTYEDYINSDFVIISHQFFVNKKFFKEISNVFTSFTNEELNKKISPWKLVIDNYYREQGNIIRDNPHLYQFYWNRIIVDEFQELMYNGSWNFIVLFKATYKWLMSGTPFSHNDNYNKMINFLTNFQLMAGNHVKEIGLFRRNTIKSTLKETQLDRFKVNEYIIWINFTIQERTIYQSQKNYYNTFTFLRQFCCSPFNTEFSTNCKTFDEIIELLRDNNYKKLRQINSDLENYTKHLVELQNNINGLPDNEENHVILQQVRRNINDFNRRLEIVVKDLNIAKSTEEYYKNLEENIKKSDDIECSICFCDIESMTMTKCGHVFCTECINMVQNNKCPTCSKPYTKKDLIIVDNNPKEEQKDELSKYGSKFKAIVKWIMKTLENPENNIIIFMEWENVMTRIRDVLAEFKISSEICKGNKSSRENAISRFNSPQGRIIMLCSAYASHGTNLTKANKIAIINPIGGTAKYREDIENQAIARAKRIGQRKDIDVVRFVIKNTIEEDLYKESLKEGAPEHEVINII